MKANEKIVYTMFPKTVGTADLKLTGEQYQIIKNIIKEEDFKVVSQASSMTLNCHVLENSKLKFLQTKIMFEINNFLLGFMKYKDKFKITTSWFTKTSKNGYSDFHNHSNAMYSGCFYIQAKEETDKIAFSNFKTTTWLLEHTEQNIYNSQKILIPTYPGLLLIFPSEVFHRIEPNVNSELRISMAFNIVPLGEIGYNDCSLTIKCK